MTLCQPQPDATTTQVVAAVRTLAAMMRPQLAERQQRRTLDPQDFKLLASAGYLLTGVPAEMGGLWRGLPLSIRPYTDMVYAIAQGDPSVALVAAMHPAVLCNWFAVDDAPEPFTDAWTAQRTACFQTAKDGALWGTLISEPGSGGDILKTTTVAELDDQGGIVLSGEKHFGSGSGISSYMITTALPAGAEIPSVFILGMENRDFSSTDSDMVLLAPWDGHGMTASQSHAFRLNRCRAIQIAWPNAPIAAGAISAQLGACLFTAVVLAIVEQAVDLARTKLVSRQESMRSFERVGWTGIVNQAWTMRQVFNGMIAAVENESGGVAATSRGKAVCAQLAEQCMNDLGRVLGGAAFSRGAPFGQWAQDVRALGYLRPPWALAYDQLFEMAWED